MRARNGHCDNDVHMQTVNALVPGEGGRIF